MSVALSLGSAASGPIGSSEARTHTAQDEFVEKISVTVFETDFLILSIYIMISNGVEKPECKIS
jgi:hypothetical protein